MRFKEINVALSLCAILFFSTIVGQPAGATITKSSPSERQILGEAQADELYVVGPSGDRFHPDRLSASLKFVGTPANYWSPCGIFDKNNKMVRKFSRQAIKELSGKTGNLRCGWHKNAKGSTKATGVGFRHIKAGHRSQGRIRPFSSVPTGVKWRTGLRTRL